MLSLSLLVTMGSFSIGGLIIEKVLGKAGKVDEANMVGIVTVSVLACTVIGSVGNVFAQVRTLGK